RCAVEPPPRQHGNGWWEVTAPTVNWSSAFGTTAPAWSPVDWCLGTDHGAHPPDSKSPCFSNHAPINWSYDQGDRPSRRGTIPHLRGTGTYQSGQALERGNRTHPSGRLERRHHPLSGRPRRCAPRVGALPLRLFGGPAAHSGHGSFHRGAGGSFGGDDRHRGPHRGCPGGPAHHERPRRQGPTSVLLAEAYLAAIRDPVLHETVSQLLARTRTSITDWLERLGTPQPEAVAEILCAFFDGSVLHRALMPVPGPESYLEPLRRLTSDAFPEGKT